VQNMPDALSRTFSLSPERRCLLDFAVRLPGSKDECGHVFPCVWEWYKVLRACAKPGLDGALGR